jgi:arsenate reductase (glutaredoxin)
VNTITLYGIPNCDTVKRARAWLAAQGVAFVFHDFKQQGLPEPELQRWLAAVGWQLLLNRRGTMWRKLPEATQASVTDAASAAAVMRATPSTVKRPVVQWADGTITVGFDEAAWAARLHVGLS